MKFVLYKVLFGALFFFSFFSASFGQEAAESKTGQKSPGKTASFSPAFLISIDTGAAYDSFTIGEHVQSITARRFVYPFRINRFETTYQLWYDVRLLAESRGYEFQNPGQEGSYGRRGRAPSENGQAQPVTTINWRDALVWCNAFSELQGLTPCYTYNGNVLRSSVEAAQCDLAECNWEADGYRLPTETEWEYAARKLMDGSFQRGDLPSGIFNAQTKWGTVAWYNENTNGSKPAGSAGTSGTNGDLGKGAANALGIFDMSGNVLEFCWDWSADYADKTDGQRSVGAAFGYQRIARGGSWSPYANFLLAADRYGFDPDEAYNYMGFRFAQTIVK